MGKENKRKNKINEINHLEYLMSRVIDGESIGYATAFVNLYEKQGYDVSAYRKKLKTRFKILDSFN